jgi:NAD(P)-dependent dehydrogenase (short-subunit alcohol dehydrogenase family)
MKIKDCVALVSGANRGIGRACVEALLEREAGRVYAMTRRPETLRDLEHRSDGRVLVLPGEIRSAADVAGVVGAAEEVTLLINNAGTAAFGHFLESPLDTIEADMQTNYFGTLNMIRAFAPIIERNGGGAIANVLSVVSLASMPGLGGYSASKAALWSATQALRADLKPRNIGVHAVFPGPVDTDMAKDIPMQKTSPQAVAGAILDGIEAGAEDIFPDPMADQVGNAWRQNPKEVERMFGAM